MGVLLFLNALSVNKVYRAVGISRSFGVVCYKNDRFAELAVCFFQQFHDLAAVLFVKISGRLVGKDHRRVGGKRSGNCHTLTLTARKFIGIVRQSVAESERVDKTVDIPAVDPSSAELQRQNNIFVSVQLGDEIEGLKNKSYPLAAKDRSLLVVKE